jgi:hypothetical protein
VNEANARCRHPGEKNGRAKVTRLAVVFMRRTWRGPGQFRGRSEPTKKFSTRKLARWFGLSQREVWAIVSPRGDRWR